MRFRKAAIAALIVACVFGTTTASATTTSTQTLANEADTEFIDMMIPHHYQAIIMSELAPSRAADSRVRNLAGRIAVEQQVEIGAMQGWQGWNGLPVTDPQSAYEDLLGMPAMLEQMGMATPEELDQLAASQGNAFDVLYLELMIEHHQGAIDMAVEVMTYGSDFYVQQMANDMLATQYTQILMMEEILADIT